jgi:hypothetical protein
MDGEKTAEFPTPVDNFKGLEELTKARTELLEYGNGTAVNSPKHNALNDFISLYEIRHNIEILERILAQGKLPDEKEKSEKKIASLNEDLRAAGNKIVSNQIPGSEYGNASIGWQNRIENFKQLYKDSYEYTQKTNRFPRISGFTFAVGPTDAVKNELHHIASKIK